MNDRQPPPPTAPASTAPPPRAPAPGEAPPHGEGPLPADSAGGTDPGSGVFLLHEDPPLSPLFDTGEPIKVHREVFDFTRRLRTPGDATPADIRSANAAFLKVNSKCFDATEEAMGGYPDLLKRTLRRMPLAEFRVRRVLCRGLFTVVQGMTKVVDQIRTNAVIRTDELADHARFALEEAKQAATGPDGKTDPQAQGVYDILDAAFQRMIGKQQQGKSDLLKVQEHAQQQAGDHAALLEAAYAKITMLESTVQDLQRKELLNTPPTGSTPPVHPAKGHNTAPATPGTTATPPTPNNRSLPRK